MLLQLALIFVLNAVSNCLGTLKSIFISKQILKPAYITTFIDALVFTYAVKLVTLSNSIAFVLMFALGKMAGAYLANYIEKKLALGVLEVTVYKHSNEESKALADRLRAEGYSVTTSVGYGLQGQNRLVLSIIVKRKEFQSLWRLLSEDGKRVNMVVKDVSKAVGKIGDVLAPKELKTG